jgi:hypothetical protein
MRVADVEYTSGGQRRFDRSQFERTDMQLWIEVRSNSGKHRVEHIDSKTDHLDGIVVLSWIQHLLNEGTLTPSCTVVGYQVRNALGDRVYVNVYPLDDQGNVREES